MRNCPGDASTYKQFGTILAWPAGATQADLMSIFQAAGYDVFDCRQLIKREPPFFMGRVRDTFEQDVLPKLEARGVAAAVFSQDQIDTLPTPVSAKALHAAIGSPKPMYSVDPWRGDPTVLLMEEVFLIVRAAVGRTKSTVEPMPRDLTGTAAIFAGPEAMILHEAAQQSQGPQAMRKTTGRAAEVIELFRLDGTRVRINSEKFNFEILRESRGLTNRQNMDQLMLMLSEQAVNAEIDLDFARFNPPPNTVRAHSTTGVNGATVTNVDAWPSFELYAAWRYLVLRVRCGLQP